MIINELRGHWSLVTSRKHAYFGICEIWLELFGGYKNKKKPNTFSPEKAFGIVFLKTSFYLGWGSKYKILPTPV